MRIQARESGEPREVMQFDSGKWATTRAPEEKEASIRPCEIAGRVGASDCASRAGPAIFLDEAHPHHDVGTFLRGLDSTRGNFSTFLSMPHARRT